MVLDRPGVDLSLRELAVPTPQERQVLVEVHACGVCRTDLHVLDGELAKSEVAADSGPRNRWQSFFCWSECKAIQARRSRWSGVAGVGVRRVPLLQTRTGELV